MTTKKESGVIKYGKKYLSPWIMVGNIPPGTCPECAEIHDPKQPHNKASLVYQYKFYNQHGRFPTWADAMAHCSDETKNQWVEAGQSLLGYLIAWISDYKFEILGRGDYEIVQYTGLKDRNDKEIYEGDLVAVADYSNREGLYKVVWDEESLMYVLEDAYGDKEKMCEFEHYLVKGNIYENPELLD